MVEETNGAERRPFFDRPMCRCGFRSHPCYGSFCEDCWAEIFTKTTKPRKPKQEVVYISPATRASYGMTIRRGKRK